MNTRERILDAAREAVAAHGWSGVTMASVGRSAGVSRQSVNAIETGKYDPSLPLAFRIGDVFGMTIEEIFLRD